MRGLPIIVFAALFAYIACALPSISRRTPFTARGTLGSLRPRGFRELLSKVKGKPAQGANKETNAVPQAGIPSIPQSHGHSLQDPGSPSPRCKGKQKVDYACCNYPNSVQYAWENHRGDLISRKETVNQVYMLKSEFKGESAVVQAIPVINDAVPSQVADLVLNLQLAHRVLGFAIEENDECLAVDVSHLNPLIPDHRKHPFKTYFIVMPFMGDRLPADYITSMSPGEQNHIKKLQNKAIAVLGWTYGIQIEDIKAENFVYKISKTREVEEAEIVGLDHVILSKYATSKKASLVRIEPEKFCSHNPNLVPG